MESKESLDAIDRYEKYVEEHTKIGIDREKTFNALFPKFGFKIDKKKIRRDVIERYVMELKNTTNEDVEKGMGNIFG